jgi:hypothetical protein
MGVFQHILCNFEVNQRLVLRPLGMCVCMCVLCMCDGKI